MGIRDVVKLENLFAKIVASAPDRIECKSQNMPITNFLEFQETWNLPVDETFAEKRRKLNTGYESEIIHVFQWLIPLTASSIPGSKALLFGFGGFVCSDC